MFFKRLIIVFIQIVFSIIKYLFTTVSNTPEGAIYLIVIDRSLKPKSKKPKVSAIFEFRKSNPTLINEINLSEGILLHPESNNIFFIIKRDLQNLPSIRRIVVNDPDKQRMFDDYVKGSRSNSFFTLKPQLPAQGKTFHVEIELKSRSLSPAISSNGKIDKVDPIIKVGTTGHSGSNSGQPTIGS